MTSHERFYPNYNVRVDFELGKAHAWCRAQNIPARTFVNMDGGGMNFDILEFKILGHAKLFARNFGIYGKEYIWVEVNKREIRYLNEFPYLIVKEVAGQ